MKGRIYSNKGGHVVRFGREVSRWFKNLDAAERFLTGLRWENDQGTYDARDHRPNKPLSFSNLSEQYLAFKQKTVKHKSFNNLKNYMSRAVGAWEHTNVKTIGYAEIEDFLFSQGVSDKTRANIKSCLHDFFTWLRKRRVITLQQFPEFPEVKYELGMRAIIDKSTQVAVIDEVHRISYDINPKIWLGIRWLSIYIGMRPGEMLSLKEKAIDVHMGALFVSETKEKKPKTIFLLDDDIEMLKQFPKGLPDLPFFRHPAGISGATAGSKFGQRYLYKWWKKACKNLGIEGVDLYGGTRHSTATALSETMTPEQIKAGTMHSTNKAFERYFQAQARDARKVYQAADLQRTYNMKDGQKSSKVMNLNK